MYSSNEANADRYLFLNNLRRHGYAIGLLDPKSTDNTPSDQDEQILTLPPTVIEHRTFIIAAAKIATIHLKAKQTHEAHALVLTGQSGSGKSTLIQWYLERNPPVSLHDRDITPVIVVTTPSRPSVTDLAEAILISLKDVSPEEGKKTEKTRRIKKLLIARGVELIILDEFQDFFEHGRKASLEVTNWLKTLISESKTPIVLSGLPRCGEIIKLNEQMGRRFARRHYLQPFTSRAPSFAEFRGVLRELYRRVPVPAIEFHQPAVAERFLMASEGLFDYVVKIVNSALEIAQLRRCEIDLNVLAEAFREVVWPLAPDRLNPFLTEEPKRSLRQPDEPFSQWDCSFNSGERAWPTKH